MLHDLKYLTFEVGSECNLAGLHSRCPVNDPSRYQFGSKERPLDDETIVLFWEWAHFQHHFDGVLLWHLYNEPTLQQSRIERLITRIRAMHPEQRTHLWTNNVRTKERGVESINHIQLTDYRNVRPEDLDNRMASVTGEGRPYQDMSPSGFCGRQFGWELVIDAFGNWNLCCNDWRCEESCGNIMADQDWDAMLNRFKLRAQIAWTDAASYAALPRLCRACMDQNSSLHQTAVQGAGW